MNNVAKSMRFKLLIKFNDFKFMKLRCYANYASSNLHEHQQNLMAKGLPKVKPIQGVKHVVLVCSGKGGVGKSTTAVNIATSLKVLNPSKNIGILDTDLFGPTIPLMMNLNETPLLTKDDLMEPLINYGVKCISIGFLIKEGAPVIWRGLMVMQALDKLLRQVFWDSIDYLIVDTPPGTGDTLLSLIQNIPISGVVLVTTPHIAALNVTRRGAAMFQKLKVPIIGMVENMSSIKCPICKEYSPLFGTGTSALADKLDISLLQSIPMQQCITDSSDKGIPVVVAEPTGEEAGAYKEIGKKIVKFLETKDELL
ncbi:hypothetical protein FQA39_LY01496 [Lamprigera yunnana]|nr:hypothetical protein FQA39_LY01496 [Lamprigera yunnana]